MSKPLNSSEWFVYYSDQNRQLLDIIKNLEFGKIIVEIEVHEKQPVKMIIWPGKKIRIEKCGK